MVVGRLGYPMTSRYMRHHLEAGTMNGTVILPHGRNGFSPSEESSILPAAAVTEP
jgi:hypothetical protein